MTKEEAIRNLSNPDLSFLQHYVARSWVVSFALKDLAIQLDKLGCELITSKSDHDAGKLYYFTITKAGKAISLSFVEVPMGFRVTGYLEKRSPRFGSGYGIKHYDFGTIEQPLVFSAEDIVKTLENTNYIVPSEMIFHPYNIKINTQDYER